MDRLGGDLNRCVLRPGGRLGDDQLGPSQSNRRSWKVPSTGITNPPAPPWSCGAQPCPGRQRASMISTWSSTRRIGASRALRRWGAAPEPTAPAGPRDAGQQLGAGTSPRIATAARASNNGASSASPSA